MTTPLVVVSRFLPDPAGPASARLLHGFATGARLLGRDLRVWSWWPGEAPGTLPPWVRWEPLAPESTWRLKARALLRPRSDVLAHAFRVPADVIAVAEEPLSAPVVARHPRSVVTVHYAVGLDRQAVGAPLTAAHWQDRRAERAATRRVRLTTAYSSRVAAALEGAGAGVVPAAVEIPARLPVVDAPVAACVADWSWPPNRIALDRLRAAWPLVRAALPAAELLLAGSGLPPGDVDGVTALGRVGDSSEVLGRAAALVFPVPPTSGPKVKVLEAMSLGVPVVTTPAGLEGIDVDPDAAVVVEQPATGWDPQAFATAVVGLLHDPVRRADLAARARAAVVARHAPEPAARARLAVIDAAFSPGGHGTTF